MKTYFVIVLLFFVTACALRKSAEIIVVDENTILIDVRTQKEYEEGHLQQAINIPHAEIREKIEAYVKDKEKKVILYCRSGRRSSIAEKVLKELGYKNVIDAGEYKKLRVQEKIEEKRHR